MGFGIFFIGYILTFVLSIASYGYVFEFLGYLIMLFALTKLWEYNAKFKFPFFAAIPLILIAVYSIFYGVSDIIGLGFIESATVGNVLEYAKIIFELGFHGALALAIAAIATDTGLDIIKNNALRNYVIYILYFAVAAVSIIPPINASSAGKYVTMTAWVAGLFCIALFAILIFSCYKNICDEGDTEMKSKESRFEFVNKMRAEYDEKEQKAREADLKYKHERAQRKKNKKK